MTFQSILVATDLSVQENIAVRRALRLAIAHDATLKLKSVPPTRQASDADFRRFLAAVDRQDAAPELVQFAGDLDARARLEVVHDAGRQVLRQLEQSATDL